MSYEILKKSINIIVIFETSGNVIIVLAWRMSRPEILGD